MFVCIVVSIGLICSCIIAVSYINKDKPTIIGCQHSDCKNFKRIQEPCNDPCDMAA